MVTYGTNPGMGLPISARVPAPEDQSDPSARRALEHALEYMDLRPGQALLGQKVDVPPAEVRHHRRVTQHAQATDFVPLDPEDLSIDVTRGIAQEVNGERRHVARVAVGVGRQLAPHGVTHPVGQLVGVPVNAV